MSITSITSQAKQKPIIGMVHLAALPGSPRSQMSVSEIAALAMHDAKALVQGGVHALMVENFGDVPFSPTRVDTQTVATMTRIIYEIRAAFPKIPLGVNVLRNDGVSALSIAAAVDAQYVRINVLSGARLTDQGTIESCAYDVLRTRKNLNAESIEIMADVDVKHSYPLAPVSVEQEVADLFDRSLANAVIVSGSGTGGAVDIEKLKRIKNYAGNRMVCLGSGVNQSSLGELLAIADCAIVGTAFKIDGDVRKKVDQKRVEALMQEHRAKFK